MKKILFVASTLSHIENFHVPYLKYFKENGFEVHVLGVPNNKHELKYVDKIYPIKFKKNILSISNFINVFKIAEILKIEQYNIIELNTTLASFFTRLGIMLLHNKNTLIINIVHGYLFDNNTNFIKRYVLLLCEQLVKPVTNSIIVMNSIDYSIANRYKLYTDSLHFINGMGVTTSKFPYATYSQKLELRKAFNFTNDDFLLIYVAEFSKRKNQKFLIDCLYKLFNDGYTSIKLILLGNGKLLNDAISYSKQLNVYDNIIFPGYIKNPSSYYQLSDICVSSSRIEGLPFNIVEAMSTGLPVVASKIKGHIDLVENNINGFLYNYNDTNEFCKIIKNLYNQKDLINSLSKNSHKLSRNYSLDNVILNNIQILFKEYNYYLNKNLPQP